MPVCKRENCNEPSRSLGLCKNHYQQHWAKNTKCEVDGCGKSVSNAKHCRMHRNRFEKYGSLELPKKEITYCTKENCNERNVGLGLCSHHYRLYYNRTLKGKFSNIRKNAELRGLEFTLSFEDYEKIMKDYKCSYCKNSLEDSAGGSLDRIDNSKGYLVDNVIPCCWQCNDMRGQHFSHDEFIYILKCLKDYRTLNKSY